MPLLLGVWRGARVGWGVGCGWLPGTPSAAVAYKSLVLMSLLSRKGDLLSRKSSWPVCVSGGTAAAADRLQEAIASLGVTETNLTKNDPVPWENEIPHSTAKSFCRASGRGRGTTPCPLGWWPHTGMTPQPPVSSCSYQSPLRRAELMAWMSLFS